MSKYFIPRSRKYIFIILTATIFSLITFSKSFSEENIFTVDNVEVEGKIDLNFSRDKFINKAFLKSFEELMAKIILSSDLEKIKNKTKEDTIRVFNDAINNIRPNLEVRSRRVGGATYQVPVEVKTKRSQTLALRWLLAATRKRKYKTMSDKLFNELMDASQRKGAAMKKREDTHRMAESNKAFAHYRW